MELVRKTAGKTEVRDLSLKEHVYLSPAQQVMANLEVVKVEYKPLFKVFEAAGIINYDQTQQSKISACVPGKIEVLHANMAGMTVTKGKPVAELFSPELAAAEEDYIGLYQESDPKERGRQFKDSSTLLYKSRLHLVQLGFTEREFKELCKSSRATVRIPIYPSMNGVITEKYVQEGQYVKAGDSLFEVADLSKVWGDLDVYEDEFPYLKVGQQVAMLSRSYPAREFFGRITYVYPYLNPKTRTNRVRVAISNQQQLLKPDMVISATIQVPLGTGLAVPSEAVVNAGDRNLVWLQVKQGVFVPREVTVGVRYRNDTQILAGLKKDDAIASSGAYLIDSEAQLKPGSRPVSGSQDTSPATNPTLHQPPPNIPKGRPNGSKDTMDMSDMDMGGIDMKPPSASHPLPVPKKAKQH